MAVTVDEFFDYVPSLLRPRMPARFNKPAIDLQRRVHSASSWGDRAIKIMSQPVSIWGRNFRSTSRIRRFARLRATALPTARLAETPNLEIPFPLGAMTRIVNGWAYDFPVRRTRLNSVELVSRYLRSIYLIRLHSDPRNTSSSTPKGGRRPPAIFLSLPIYLFNVIVHAHREMLSSLQASTL
jgi:hypothetical protein